MSANDIQNSIPAPKEEQGQTHDNKSLNIAIEVGVIGGFAMCIAIALLVFLSIQKRKKGKFHDAEKGVFRIEFNGITPPPAAYKGVESRSGLTLRLDDSVTEKTSLDLSPPALSLSPPSSEGSPPVANRWKHKRVPVPRLSRLPPSPHSRTRSWLAKIPPSPHFSRRSSRVSRKSTPPSPVSPVPSLPIDIPPHLQIPTSATVPLHGPGLELADDPFSKRPVLNLAISARDKHEELPGRP